MIKTAQKAVFMRFSEPYHDLQIYISQDLPNYTKAIKLKSYGHAFGGDLRSRAMQRARKPVRTQASRKEQACAPP